MHSVQNLEDTSRSNASLRSIPSSASGAGDRALLADAVLAAHFSAATQGVRLEELQERAAKADIQMTHVREELAEAEAQEAVQCIKWRQMYTEEAAQARAFRDKAEYAEVRLQSSAMLAAEANADAIQVECLRTEVVERGATWAADRERLYGEIYDFQAKLAERDGKTAGYELQVHSAAQAAAQATVERCNQMEALAHSRAEAGRSNSRAEAADAARALAEERRLKALASVQVLESECAATSQSEMKAMENLRSEVEEEAREAQQARAELARVKQNAKRESEATEHLRSVEKERQRDLEATTRMHVDAREALEQLINFNSALKAKEDKSTISDTATLQSIQEQLLEQSQVASAREAATAAEAREEVQAANAAKQQTESLRTELAMQSRAQRDLHSELQALSDAAAAVRAVAKAKDQTISELHAAHRKMATEMAMQRVSKSSTTPNKMNQKEEPSTLLSLERIDAKLTGKSPPQTPCDTMSVTSNSTQPMNAGFNVPKGNDGTSDSLSASYSTVTASNQVPLLPGGIPSHVGGSPVEKVPTPKVNEMGSLQAALDKAVEATLQAAPASEDDQPLHQAAAFLNAAAARAAAAASAVEAFIPLFPSGVPSARDEVEVGLGESASKASASPAQAARAGATAFAFPGTPPDSSTLASRPVSEVSAPQGGPSWDEAQAAMTDQIRKDIALLRRAVFDSGMPGSALDNEVQALLSAAELAGGALDPSLVRKSGAPPGAPVVPTRAASTPKAYNRSVSPVQGQKRVTSVNARPMLEIPSEYAACLDNPSANGLQQVTPAARNQYAQVVAGAGSTRLKPGSASVEPAARQLSNPPPENTPENKRQPPGSATRLRETSAPSSIRPVAKAWASASSPQLPTRGDSGQAVGSGVLPGIVEGATPATAAQPSWASRRIPSRAPDGSPSAPAPGVSANILKAGMARSGSSTQLPVSSAVKQAAVQHRATAQQQAAAQQNAAASQMTRAMSQGGSTSVSAAASGARSPAPTGGRHRMGSPQPTPAGKNLSRSPEPNRSLGQPQRLGPGQAMPMPPGTYGNAGPTRGGAPPPGAAPKGRPIGTF